MPPASGTRRICIIGAGGLGCCLALELASRGENVTLIEKNAVAVAESSFYNEGKIHLGYIYAKDRSLATARQMIDGALEFMPGLKRWLSIDSASLVSTPFYYGVHTESLMSPGELQGHYDQCEDIYRMRSSATGSDYLDLGVGSNVRRLNEAEFPADLNPEFIRAVFETTEYAVDPRQIATALRAAIESEPRIDLRLNTRAIAIEEIKHGFEISLEAENGVYQEQFTDVVNATWFARLALDRPLGISPPGRWSHRYKFGNRILVKAEPAIPSLTMVQGPFGDVVNFGASGLFLSWYPIGRTDMSLDEVPPDWANLYSPSERRNVSLRSFAELKKRCPALESQSFSPDDIDSGGCVIYALGEEDVQHESSRLHERVDIGIQSRGRYHSVDTGKYTLVPYWAIRAADRVLGTTR